jgi:hypothetical protein
MNAILWSGTLDNRYECTVEHTSQYKGQLRIFDNQTDSVLLIEEVGVSYGATFGADMGDVSDWQNRCSEFIDSMASN